MQQEILTTISRPNATTRLEVTVDRSIADKPHIELRRLAWGKGVGWFCQQTLQLDATEAEALLLALRQNCRKWKKSSEQPEGKVIPFPTRMEVQESCAQQSA